MTIAKRKAELEREIKKAKLTDATYVFNRDSLKKCPVCNKTFLDILNRESFKGWRANEELRGITFAQAEFKEEIEKLKEALEKEKRWKDWNIEYNKGHNKRLKQAKQEAQAEMLKTIEKTIKRVKGYRTVWGGTNAELALNTVEKELKSKLGGEEK